MSIIDIEPTELDKYLDDTNKPIFLRFKSSTCGHCVAMTPAWKEVAKRTNDNISVVDVEVPFNIGEISNHKATKNFVKAGQSVPRMYIINGNDISEYDSERTADAMVDKIQKLISMSMSGGRKKRSKSRKSKKSTTRKLCPWSCRRTRYGRPCRNKRYTNRRPTCSRTCKRLRYRK